MPSVIWLSLLVFTLLSATPCFAETPAGNERAALAELETLWSQKKWPEPTDEAVTVGQTALERNPKSFEVVWRTARA